MTSDSDSHASQKPQRSVGKRALSGAKWMTVSQLLKQAVNLGVKLLLARLLLPRDFGIVALATVFVSFAETFVTGGFVQAMVQRPDLDDEAKSTGFWMHVSLGAASMIALILLAPVISALLEEPAVTPVVRVLALALLLSGLAPTHDAILRRALRFRALAARYVIGVVVGGIVGIIAALAGWGAWALVAMLIAKLTSQFMALVVAVSWRPTMTFDVDVARGLWRFARYQLLGRLFNFGQRNVDNLLVGGVLGVSALGVYSLAYQAVLLPLQYVTRPILTVVFAALCNLSDDDSRARAYGRTLEVLVGVTWPLSLLAAVSVPPVLTLIVGEQWSGVTPVFSVLALAPLLQSPRSAVEELAKANGLPSYALKLQMYTSVLAVTGFCVGLPFGVIGVAAGYTVASFLLLPGILYVLPRIGADVRPTLRVLSRASLAAGIAGGAGLLVRLVLEDSLHPLLVALLSGLTIVGVWAGLAALWLQETWRVARMLVRRRRMTQQ